MCINVFLFVCICMRLYVVINFYVCECVCEYVSFHFVSFLFVSFRFGPSRFVSFFPYRFFFRSFRFGTFFTVPLSLSFQLISFRIDLFCFFSRSSPFSFVFSSLHVSVRFVSFRFSSSHLLSYPLV